MATFVVFVSRACSAEIEHVLYDLNALPTADDTDPYEVPKPNDRHPRGRSAGAGDSALFPDRPSSRSANTAS
jgi:hypothetical protein